MGVDVNEGWERYRASQNRVRELTRELRKIVVFSDDLTDSELQRMEHLCAAIGESLRDCLTLDARHMDSYWKAHDIIARHQQQGEEMK